MLASWRAGDEETLRRRLTELLDGFGEPELASFWERVGTTGGSWGHHPPDPVARAISRWVHELVLAPASTLQGAEALEAARAAPVLLMGNHLSFADLNILDFMISRTPFRDVADGLSVIVGPKVYADPLRRLASLCFGTIKTAQSTSRASGEARMSSREVARISRRTLHTAHEQMRVGHPLAVFVEGSRSRSGAMLRTLAAVSRYLEREDALVLPWGIAGSEILMPPGEDRVTPGRVSVRLGRPIAAATLRERCAESRRLIMDTVGFLIAALLPAPYRGMYAKAERKLRAAYQIARELMPAR